MGTLGHWVAGTPSASAKRSVEQKMVEQKFGGDPWPLGSRGPPSASAKRSAELKMVELKLVELKLAEQKFGGDLQPLGGGDS